MQSQADAPGGDSSPALRTFWRAGRTGWAFVGLVLALWAVGYAASRLSLLLVPVILALFPATLLVPVADWLKAKRVPAVVAAIGSLLAGVVLILAIIGGLVPLVAAELPQLVEAAGEGLARLQQTLEQQFGIEIGGVSELLQRVQERAPEVGQMAGQALGAATAALEMFASILLLIVVLFFYLKDSRRLTNGVISLAPAHLRPHAGALADRAWKTLGAYFRGQLLIALVDAVLIGIGLVIVGVPLPVPLAVLVFFGGLFPVVGAVVSGTLAVLVALAGQGLIAGLIVLAIVVGVQQLEGNVLAPLILGHAIHLHPLIVLLSIGAGAVLLGILGAFLAVPTAAVIAEIIEYVRDPASRGASEPADDRPMPAQSAATG